MQDPSSLYSQINPSPQPQFPEQEHLKCPRCDSTNTKFCYYNNYNLSQPRHFCKSCRRYWTKGGALRNIPVGGGSRKNAKRSSSSSAKRHAAQPQAAPPKPSGGGENHESQIGNSFAGQFGHFLEAAAVGGGGSFGSLLGTGGGQFGNFLDGPALQVNDSFVDPGPVRNVEPRVDGNPDGFLNIGGGGGGDWSGSSNGWPDLAMYTPGSTFQ